MNLGEKIKCLRTKESITQEVLAEKLNVSRSAIAKWESDNGMPDISNLKMLSQMFGISIDELLTDECEIDEISLKEIKVEEGRSEYEGYYWDIELKGWNDGVFDVLIVGEDKDFLFYQKKDDNLYGLIGKRYIKSITKNEKCNVLPECLEFEGRNYFCRRHVLLEVAVKEGLLRGFLDFRNDDYMDVLIQSFTDTEVSLKFGGDMDVHAISKIEELE